MESEVFLEWTDSSLYGTWSDRAWRSSFMDKGRRRRFHASRKLGDDIHQLGAINHRARPSLSLATTHPSSSLTHEYICTTVKAIVLSMTSVGSPLAIYVNMAFINSVILCHQSAFWNSRLFKMATDLEMYSNNVYDGTGLCCCRQAMKSFDKATFR